MNCPICGLINPATAERCDCGYDFKTRLQLPKVKEKWLRVVTIAAAVSIVLISSCIVSTRGFFQRLFVPAAFFSIVFGLPPSALYAVVLLRLRSQTVKGIKKGLTLAVAGGSLVWVPCFLVLQLNEAWMPLVLLFGLAQVVLVAGAIKTYYSMERQPSDARMLKRGFASVGAVVLPVVLLLGVAIPGMARSRVAANEASATGALRTLNTAEVTYSATYKSGFSPDLQSLGPPARGGQASATAADLVDQVLSGNGPGGGASNFVKNGYTFVYKAGTSTPIRTYTLNADPQTRGTTGQRSFFTDESGVIRSNTSAAATSRDSPI